MDKFSKLKYKREPKKKEEVLFSKGSMEIIDFENWSIVKDRDCVFCIPILLEENAIVLRYEYIPSFKYVDGQEYHITLVGGGIDQGEEPEDAIVRELREETGIVLSDDYKIESVKPLFYSKGSVNKISFYIIPLNEREYHEEIAKGDGSIIEKKSKSVKIDIKRIKDINTSDIFTDYMLMKVKEYLNFPI